MALTKCKECGEQVSSKAAACPKCGNPFKQESKTSGCAMTALWLIIIAVVISVVGTCVDKNQKEKEEAAMSPEQKAERAIKQAAAAKIEAANKVRSDAVYTCRQFIKAALKNPDSAEFPQVAESTPVQINGATYLVQLTVRATNSFGGVVTEIYNCQLIQSEKDWRLLSLKALK